jgi:tRNA (guanosine-2'-O-)-methyltransferase
MEEKRIQRFKEVVRKRQPNLTVILENVHDQHNIGAVLRTCDSVGIMEIFVLQSNPSLQASNITLGQRTSAGSRKWVDVHFYNDTQAAFKHIRSKYDKVYATHLDAEARSLHDLDMTEAVALLFGNEHEGVSKETLALCDGNFIIPQAGFVQSLNISVACAVTLYEAYRQRAEKGFYSQNPPLDSEGREALYQEYVRRHKERVTNKIIPAKG